MRNVALLLFLLVLLIAACEKQRDTYYERPDWLQGPLYEQIKSTGEYDEFIQLADYLGYDEFLSSRLTFTLFLPTNEAFQEFYQENGVGSFQELDTSYLKSIIDFHLMENSWDSTRMIRKTSWGYWGGSYENFRTPSYYAPEIDQEGQKNIYYNKTFLHLFSSAFIQYYGLGSIDYETFYPNSVYTGYNIDRAALIDNQLGAENGFYYVIDKVLIPRTTADQAIGTNPDFSVFKGLMDIFVDYKYNASVSEQNREYDSLFNRSYSLNVDLANEKMTDSDPDGFYRVLHTVMVPENQVIIDYFDDNFPAYGGLENVPNIIVKYFVEAHLVFNKKLFPTVLARAENETNDFSDEIDFELGNGIISQQLCSNAIIYGVDRAINTNAFSTVSGPIIKNPDYRIFTMMLELSGEMRTFFKQEIGHVAFVLPDDMMEDMGFSYYEGDPVDFTDDRIFLDNDEMTNTEIKNFLKDYISITYKDLEASSEVYIGTKNGQYLEITDESVKGVFGEASIVNHYEATNGSVLEVDRTLGVSSPYTIEDFLNDNKDTYSGFFSLCQKGGYVGEDGRIAKLSLFNGVTLLLPTNEAVEEMMGSYLPLDPSQQDYKALVQYQVISERVIFTDDSFPESAYGTDLFVGGIRMKITAAASDNQVNTIDLLGNLNNFGPGPDKNFITSNGVIHVVDKMSLY